LAETKHAGSDKRRTGTHGSLAQSLMFREHFLPTPWKLEGDRLTVLLWPGFATPLAPERGDDILKAVVVCGKGRRQTPSANEACCLVPNPWPRLPGANTESAAASGGVHEGGYNDA